MKIKAGNTLVGMQVFSPLLNEYFKVVRVQRPGNYVLLREGIYCLKCRADQDIEVKDES